MKLGGGGLLLACALLVACAYEPVLNAEPITIPRDRVEQYWMLVRIDPMDYPAAARRSGVEGRVGVECLIDSNGRVAEAKVVESEPPGVFDSVALEAARSMQYYPAPTNRDMRPVRTIRVFEYVLPQHVED